MRISMNVSWKMLRSNGVALVLFGCSLVFLVYFFWFIEGDKQESFLFPLISVALICFGLFFDVVSIPLGRMTPDHLEQCGESRPHGFFQALLLIAVGFVSIFFVPHVGFLPATLSALVGSYFLIGGRSILSLLLMLSLWFGIVQGIFVGVLHVPLPPSIWPTAVGRIFGIL